MKAVFSLIFFFIAVILSMCAGGAKRSTKKIAPTVTKLMIVSAFTVFMQVIIVAIGGFWSSRVAYNLFYIGIDWMLYYVLHFCYDYTHQTFDEKWWDNLLKGILIADNISLLINIFTQHVTQIEMSVTPYGEIYYRMSFKNLYQIHLFISYAIFMVAVLALIRKILNTASIYWVSYFMVLGILFVIVLWDLVYVISGSVIDYSIVGYAIGGLLIYYFSIHHKSVFVINSMLVGIISDIDDGFVFFDMDGECVYANDKARDLLGVGEADISKCREEIDAWVRDENLYQTNDEFLMDTYSRVIGGKSVTLRISSQTMKRGRYKIGIYYRLNDYTTQIAAHRRERYLAYHDELTGLYNKTALFEIIEQRIHENPEKKYYLLALDIRDFKGVNEVLGRQVGDDLLVRIAQQLQSLDKLEAVYGRLVADKFGVLLEQEYFHARKISKMLNNLKFVDSDTSYMVVIHMGIYEMQPNDSTPIDVMFDRAIFAISKIKSSYEERVVFYDESSRRDMLWEQTISSDLNNALEYRQFKPFLQPQVDANQNARGAEVLVRWEHPTEGLLTPARFIGVFEKNGMILSLDRYMWEMACQILHEWKQKGYEGYYLSVNISPRDIYLADVYQIITSLVEQYEVNPGNLKLEITETMVSDTKRCIDLIEKLQTYGFIIEMDDFGSGYSSLNTLKNIPVDVIKMDLGFLRETADEEKSQTILQFVIALSQKLNMESVAEGIETKEQFEFLKGCGCEIFQGYYFSQPLPLYEFEKVYIKKEV